MRSRHLLGLVGTTSLAWYAAAQVSQPSGVQVASGTYVVEDGQNSINIGTSTVTSGGRMGFVDNPKTSHPPDTNATYSWNASLGGYQCLENPDHVVFCIPALGEGYVWRKRDVSLPGSPVIDDGLLLPN